MNTVNCKPLKGSMQGYGRVLGTKGVRVYLLWGPSIQYLPAMDTLASFFEPYCRGPMIVAAASENLGMKD